MMEVDSAMQDGRCPKCAAATIYQKHNGIAADSQLTIALGLLSYAEFDTYICASCGYTESYIADRRALAKIAQQWHKVPESRDGS